MEAWKACPSPNYPDFSLRFGVATQTLQRVLSDAGLIGNGRPRVPVVAPSQRRAISNFHAILGAEISRHLNETQLTKQIVEKITEADIAVMIGISTKLFNNLKVGQYDPTLTQLRKIAEWMELSLSDLMANIQAKTPLYEKRRLSSG